MFLLSLPFPVSSEEDCRNWQVWIHVDKTSVSGELTTSSASCGTLTACSMSNVCLGELCFGPDIREKVLQGNILDYSIVLHMVICWLSHGPLCSHLFLEWCFHVPVKHQSDPFIVSDQSRAQWVFGWQGCMPQQDLKQQAEEIYGDLRNTNQGQCWYSWLTSHSQPRRDRHVACCKCSPWSRTCGQFSRHGCLVHMYPHLPVSTVFLIGKGRLKRNIYVCHIYNNLWGQKRASALLGLHAHTGSNMSIRCAGRTKACASRHSCLMTMRSWMHKQC